METNKKLKKCKKTKHKRKVAKSFENGEQTFLNQNFLILLLSIRFYIGLPSPNKGFDIHDSFLPHYCLSYSS